MKDSSEKGKTLLRAGQALILFGLLCNQWVLALLFSRDGVLETPTRVVILLFQLLWIVAGVVLIVLSRSALLRRVFARRNRLLYPVYLIVVSAVLTYSGFMLYRTMISYRDLKKPAERCERWSARVFKFDGILGWRPLPDARATCGFYGQAIPQFNDRYGFRVSAGDTARTFEEGPLLLALGCSITQALQVPAESSFVYVAARDLDAEPLNAGISGGGLSQMLILARRFIPQFKPEYVVVQYSPWLVTRSIGPTRKQKTGYSSNPYFYLASGGSIEIHPTTFHQRETPTMHRYLDGPPNFREYCSYLWVIGLPGSLSNDLQLAVYRLKRLVRIIPLPIADRERLVRFVYGEFAGLCRENGSRLVIVILDLKREQPPEIELLRELPGAIVVDGGQELYDRLPARNFEEYKRVYGHWSGGSPVLVDTHFNATAHRIVGQAITRAVK